MIISTEGGEEPKIKVDNGTLQLKANVLPTEANQNVVWSIAEDETFASIDQNGLVTAITSNAAVTVKAASAENATIFSTFSIEITNQQSEVQPQSLKVTTANDVFADIFQIGGTLQLLATTLPAEADQYVTWSVEEGNSVVSVNENGLVTGLSEGIAVIKATRRWCIER